MTFFFLENRAVYEIMWETIVDVGKPRDDKTHAHCIPKVTKPLRECNTCCFSTATVVVRTRHSFADCLFVLTPKSVLYSITLNVKCLHKPCRKRADHTPTVQISFLK